MNFKTTIVLIVLLAVAGGALWYTREKGNETPKTAEEKQKLFADVKPEDVTKISITPGDGKRMALEKTNAAWRMTEPVSAPAEAFEVDALVRQIAELQSRGKVQTSGADATATGLASPKYTIEMSDKNGKSYKLIVGEKSAVGDNLYVSTAGPGEAQVVPASELIERLEKPASAYRDPKLVSVPTSEVKQVTISRPEGKIVLAKSGDEWKMTSPTSMPAEKSTVDDIVFGLTGLRAVEFVNEDPKEAGLYELSTPKVSATLSTTTQPTLATPATQAIGATRPGSVASANGATTQPVEIRFGRYDDVMKKNIFASSSQSPAVAKVSATILETLNKKPIELRDKRVVDLNPQQASRIEITSDLKATTKPTSRPASKKTVVLARRKEVGPVLPIGIAAPTTSATTKAADAKVQASSQASTKSTTQASTAPATKPAAVAATQPSTKWEIVEGDKMTPADDNKIDTLLNQLHPLRVEKYLENPPATQPTATYTIAVTTEGPGGTPVNQYELRLVDPGNSEPLRGDYNGLAFEAPRSLIDKIGGDFVKRPGSSSPPPSDSLPNESAPESIGP